MEQISTFEELKDIKRNGDYILSNDIDCNGMSLPCIIGDFSGVFDGNGHIIKNLIVQDEIWGDEQILSLVLSANRAVIKNVIFDNIRFEYDKKCYNPTIAALVGLCSDSTIENVTISVWDSSGKMIPAIYEANNCNIVNSKIICNGMDSFVAKYK